MLPSDPHLRPWMLFVDGENLTLRAQEIAQKRGIQLEYGQYFERNVCIWIPNFDARRSLAGQAPIPIQQTAVRAFYYTSIVGDEQKILSVWKIGFQSEVFKKDKQSTKSKGVDITLAKDFLSNAFMGNYDVAVLVAGDGDYVPMVTEVKRLGKIVYVMFFEESGLNPSLRLRFCRFARRRRAAYDLTDESVPVGGSHASNCCAATGGRRTPAPVWRRFSK